MRITFGIAATIVAAAMIWTHSASAQVKVVTNCNTQSITAANSGVTYMDQQGNLCSKDAAVLAAITSSAITPPLSVKGVAGADGSTTVTAGGTAQNLFSGATPANGFAVCNPDASEVLWVSDTTTAAANAAGSVMVPAGGSACYSVGVGPGRRPIQAVSVYGATTGHKITASSW